MIIKNNPYDKAGLPIPGKEESWLAFRSDYRNKNNPYLSATNGPLKGKERAFFEYLAESRKQYNADLRILPKELSKNLKERDAELRRRMSSEA